MTIFFKKVDGEQQRWIRTHHPMLHPTKGWREFARPAGTNRRRRLIPQGTNNVPLSNGFRAKAQKWSRDRGYLARLTAAVTNLFVYR